MGEIRVPFNKDRKPLHELLPLNQPLRIEIDPADVCNFRCDFCFQRHKKFTGRLMDRDTFLCIINQLKEFDSPICKIYLYALGEPLLNQDIAWYVEKIKSEKVADTVAITTNGSRLTNELSRSLINAGLDQLSVSVNGLCDADFERICHVKIDFDKYLSEIQWFYEHKSSCYVHVKLEGDYFTEEEKAKFFNLFSNKCDTMHIDHVADIWPDIPIDSERNLYDIAQKGDHPVCPQPFYDLCIHTDGIVTPCDAIWDYHKYKIGNIHEQSIKNIWHGEAHRRLCMDQLSGGPCAMEICNRCNFAEFGASVDISPYRKELKGKYIKQESL